MPPNLAYGANPPSNSDSAKRNADLRDRTAGRSVGLALGTARYRGNLPSATSRSSRAWRTASSACATAVSSSRTERCASITSMLVVEPASKATIVIFSTSLAVCAARRAAARARWRPQSIHAPAALRIAPGSAARSRLNEDDWKVACRSVLQSAPQPAVINRLRQQNGERPRAGRLEDPGRRQQLRSERPRRRRPPVVLAVVDDPLVGAFGRDQHLDVRAGRHPLGLG